MPAKMTELIFLLTTVDDFNSSLKIIPYPQGKMNVVNTLLAVARRAKDCGMAADIDAPPKIANAFKGLEEKFGKKFEHTATVNTYILLHTATYCYILLHTVNFSSS